jgi:hypothetical protein
MKSEVCQYVQILAAFFEWHRVARGYTQTTNQVTPQRTPNLKTASDAQFIRLAGYFEQFPDIDRRENVANLPSQAGYE